ncbi:hypothetical protein A5819_001004 [Enterococcus sp. 7E2_DIV0204]|uniref:Beta-lactamase-related domain-containing protein n=1 Tax=Candidatus Enterococcus lemimoniae TaxID=1834167 RepID=A0ABZ2T7Q3_9ENTE|nr:MULTISPECIES: serine hydrolase domain-containing protein [unclassified Enterococcus]OTN88523.1 hypothetical protein A5819_001004 [Enterococcus sp. 7E2_DIV0204]OTO70680.1 hypothetical protein A5866_002917 [Enterococcus sp. 12C11_DIV0727]OTP50992.1 hypothetical protein A5884_000178 [Enterococcus sp. 7D2_DIV0200]
MNFKEKLESYINTYDQQGYLQGNLLVADKTGILLEQSFGLASIEFNVANTSDTKYQIGSLTKAFTSMAVLILQQQGYLSSGDSINTYLDNFPNGDKITIYHCMTCTSGIPNFTSLEDFWETTMRLSWTLDGMLDLFKNLPLEFEPGSQFAYSNSGYLVLTKIVEVVSGRSYAQFLQEHIFTPLNMNNTGCMNEVDIISKLASSYSYWGKEINTPQTNTSFPLGAYGIYSTAKDLYLWDQALRRHELISKDLTKLMFTINQGSYACGWDITKINGQLCRQHFGDVSGFVNSIKQFETDEFIVIFLSNLDLIPVGVITKEISELKFDSSFNITLPRIQPTFPYLLKRFVGLYEVVEDFFSFEVIADEDLFLIVPKLYDAPYKLKLKHLHSDNNKSVFKTEKINETIVFIHQEKETFQKIIYTDYYGMTRIAKKIR